MTRAVNIVHAQSIGYAFASDTELTLPRRPRLIPELLICPSPPDGLLFAGAAGTEVIRGSSARQVLPRLLPLLDGRHDLDDLPSALPPLTARQVHDVVALLHSRGLLEDADTGPPAAQDEDTAVASFVGRHIDVTRVNRNRREALARLATARLRLIGEPELCRLLRVQLTGSGVQVLDDDPTVTVVVSTGAAPVVPGDLRDGPLFPIRLGAAEAHLGPILTDGVTACPACLAAVHPHPPGAPAPLRAELWLGLAAHQLVLELTRLGSSVAYRGLRRYVTDPVDGGGEIRLTPRMPGCPACGIPGERWAPDDPRLLGWIYHVGSSMTPRATLALKDHQSHYSGANLQLSTSRTPMMYGVAIPLPEPATAAQPGPLRLAVLATVLAKAAGESGTGHLRRRLAPTGGNLGSSRLWVLARRVEDLDPGAYLYEPHDHSLRRAGDVDDAGALHALDPHGDPPGQLAGDPDCVLLGAGDLAKAYQKYQAFAYRLVHYDAGVALAYIHLVARTLGVTLTEYPDAGHHLAATFGVARRWEFPLPTFAVGLGGRRAEPAATPAIPAPRTASAGRPATLTPPDYTLNAVVPMMQAASAAPAAIRRPTPAPAEILPARSLDQVMTVRRAIRTFAAEPPTAEAARAVVAAAGAVLRARQAAGSARSLVRPVLLVSTDLPGLAAGVYDTVIPGAELTRLSGFSTEDAVESTLQQGLAAAPVTVIIVADLRTALTDRSARGYADQATHAGAAIGAAWLAATERGLVGTAAGGVIPHGLRRAAGFDGFNDCPLLGLHLGLPAADGD